MSGREIRARWVTKDSEAKLTSMLNLPPHMQDWEIECADANRLGEFIDLYADGGLNDDDRFALMALIVSSFEDWLCEGGLEEMVVQRVRRHLMADFSLHEWTIHYWCLFDTPDEAGVFRATPLMREIWSQQNFERLP